MSVATGHLCTGCVTGSRFPSGHRGEFRAFSQVPPVHGVDLEQLNECLETQRAGPDGILVEVSLEEPGARIDVDRTVHPPEPVDATVRHEKVDVIDHAEPRFGEGRGVRHHQATASISLVGGGLVDQRVADADLIRQGLVGEEPEVGCSLIEGPDAFAAQGHGVMLDDHTTRRRHSREIDPRRDHVLGGRQTGQLDRFSTKVTESQVVLGRQSRAHVGGQPPARLERHLQEDGERHFTLAIAPEVPLIRTHVEVGGDGRAGLHHERLPRHLRDPIQELVWRAGQARDATISLVEDAVRCPIRFGRFPAAERENALLVVEDGAGLFGPDVARR